MNAEEALRRIAEIVLDCSDGVLNALGALDAIDYILIEAGYLDEE